MTKADASRFFRALIGLTEGFDVTLNEERFRFYFDHLADYSVEQIEAAIQTCARTVKVFPTVAHLREAIALDEEIKTRAAEHAKRSAR